MAFNQEEYNSAIGSSLLTRAPLNTEHPVYRAIVSRTTAKLADIAKREDTRYRGKTKVLCFESMDAEDMDLLKSLYPEFNLIDFGTYRPGHVAVVGISNLAAEWCVMQCTRYTDSLAHIGGHSVNHVLAGRSNVLLIGDNTDSNFVHRRHENTLNLVRVARESATVGALLGKAVDVGLVVAALKGGAYPSNNNLRVGVKREALVYDGMSCVLGPRQVAGTMAEIDAKICYGFFPYTPDMLVSEEGNYGGTDILFRRIKRKGVERIQFIQSQGCVMVTEIPLPIWSQWVSGHVIRIKWRKTWFYYQYELLINRGCVMFFKMTKLQTEPGQLAVSHALELPMNKDLYVVTSWRLKSLVCDTESAGSWIPIVFTANRRLIDRVYAFGMQLEKTAFTRFALRKQLKVVNDRVVVQGTNVEWHAPLSSEQLDDLSVALFARVFVDRFDSGNLSSQLMAQLKTMTTFGNSNTWDKLRIVAGLYLHGVWDATFGKVDEGIRRICDKVNALLKDGKVNPTIGISRAPTYMLMTELRESWFRRFTRYMDVDIDGWLPGFDSNLPGFLPAVATVISMGDIKSKYDKEHDMAVYAKSPAKMLIGHLELPEEKVLSSYTTELKDEVIGLMHALNEMDHEPVDRHVDMGEPFRRLETLKPAKPDFDYDPDPVYTLNSVYETIFPGNNQVESEYDVASNVFDPQNRNFSARYLKTAHVGEAPKNKRYYHSNIRAINVPKRQETLSELLSATAARNMDPPIVSKPQSFENLIPEIWRTFKKKACRPDVDVLLAKYRDDPVALGDEAFIDWMDKAKDEGVINRVRVTVNELAKSVEEYDVGQYVCMNKADVKVPLSDKIQFERIEPQVIVYHDKVLSAGFSAIFRVIVGRFLSLLAPNVHINLRKDSKDIAGFINANHPFHLEETGVKPYYLENDFSKYDKSQMELVFTLEKFIFEQLGMNQTFVDAWFMGHVDCSIRSFIHLFALDVSWQRKSGDATTAFGNVILNSMSVLYAYPMSHIYWMCFMGDDSLVCTEQVGAFDDAVKVLAEIFNLQAKTYITEAPYFASNFVVISPEESTVGLLPDPVKRIERWSMMVGEFEESWEEKFISAADVCELYKYKMYTVPLSNLVVQRYPCVKVEQANLVCNAIANLVSKRKTFRAIWEETLRDSLY